MKTRAKVLCYVAMVATVCSAAWAADYRVEETAIGLLDDILWPSAGDGYSGLSRDGLHFAYIAARGDGEAVVVDREEGPVYDAIEGPVFFVPGSTRVAYAARKGEVVVAVIDGQEGSEYDEVGRLERRPDERPMPSYPHEYMSFSRDGTRSAYKARKDNKWVAVVDGQEGPEYDEITWGPLFTDSGHWQCTARKGDNWVAIIDGRETPEYGWVGSVFFSPDGERLVYEASHGHRDSGDFFYVVDGKQWPAHRRAGSLALSREGRVMERYRSDFPVFANGGRRFIYAADKGNKWCVVVEGQEGPKYDGIYGVHVSPDGQHLAYKAWRGPDPARADHVVVLDGLEGPAYGRIGALLFSPDDRRVAYEAWRDPGRDDPQLVVVDGEEGPEYDWVAALSFSPDGQHFVYKAARGESIVVVLDGQETAEYDGVDIPRFSADGSRLVYQAARENRRFIACNGEESSHDGDVGSLVLAPEGKRFVYLVYKDPGVAVVMDGREGLLYEGIEQMPLFSADGQHVAYVGRRAGQSFAVIDGREDGGFSAVYLATTFDDRLLIGPRGEYLYKACVAAREPGPRSDDINRDAHAGTPDHRERLVVVNGQAGPPYDEIVTSRFAFQDDGALEYLAKRDNVLYRVKHIPIAGSVAAPQQLPDR